MVVTHAHHSARVACHRSGDVAIANYSGPLCMTAFESLRPRVIKESSGAACLVLRMDRSLCLMGEIPAIKGYAIVSAPGAVIVRPDQLDLWTDYARAMSFVGIRRAVFLDSELALCRDWVDWQLGVSPSSVRQSR